MDPQSVALVVGTVLAAFFGYLAAARKATGKIATSEASDLWEEADSLRAEYRKEAIELRTINAQQRLELSDLRKQCAEEAAVARERIAVLESRLKMWEGDDDPPAHLS